MRNRIPIIQRPEHFQLNRNSPLHNGLVFAGLGQYPSSTRYHDSSSRGNTGLLTGMDPATDWVWVPELNRWAVDLNEALTQYIIGTAPVTTTPLTLSAFFKIDLDGLSRDILSVSNASVAGMGWRLNAGMASAGDPVRAVTALAPIYPLSSMVGILVGQWMHGVAVFSAANNRVAYLNAVPGTAETTSAVPTNIGVYGVGVNLVSGTASNLFDGMIADPCIWNRALSPAEIAALADPSNVLLSGLILPPRRRLFVVPSVGKAHIYAVRQRELLAGAI